MIALQGKFIGRQKAPHYFYLAVISCSGTYAQFRRKACTTSNGQRALTHRNIHLSHSCGFAEWLLLFCIGFRRRFLAAIGFESCFFGGCGKENR